MSKTASFDKQQGGFVLLDVLAAIAIFALLIPGIVSFMQMTSQTTNKKVAATQMGKMTTAAKQYLMDNYSTVLSGAPYEINVSDLTSGNYLPSGYANKNPWNQDYRIFALNPADQDIHLVLVTTGGRSASAGTSGEFGIRTIPAAAAMIGSKGGYVPTGDVPGETSNTIQGAYGGWSLALSQIPANPAPGHLAASWYIDEEQFGNDYLYRNEVPGHSELNRMTTELDMDGNTIQMGDGNVGGQDGEGARKVNFEDHESGDFSCPDNDNYGGSVFYDRSEGLYVCRQGQKLKIADSMNSAYFKDAQVVNNQDHVTKPTCNAAASTPQIYVSPVYYSANDSWKSIKAVQSWASDSGSDWQVNLRVLTDKGWIDPNPSYAKLLVMTECS